MAARRKDSPSDRRHSCSIDERSVVGASGGSGRRALRCFAVEEKADSAEVRSPVDSLGEAHLLQPGLWSNGQVSARERMTEASQTHEVVTLEQSEGGEDATAPLGDEFGDLVAQRISSWHRLLQWYKSVYSRSIQLPLDGLEDGSLLDVSFVGEGVAQLAPGLSLGLVKEGREQDEEVVSTVQ